LPKIISDKFERKLMMHFRSNGNNKDTSVLNGNIVRKYLTMLEVGEENHFRFYLKDYYFIQAAKIADDKYLIDYKDGSDEDHFYMRDVPAVTTIFILNLYKDQLDYKTGFAWCHISTIKDGEVRPIHLVPGGKAIKWTDEDIDRMVAEDTSDAGIERAQSDWNEKAPKDYKSLLDAEAR